MSSTDIDSWRQYVLTVILLLSASSALALSVRIAHAETLLATLPVGTSPYGVGVDVTLNKIYMANAGTNTVTVIEGSNNSMIASVPVGVDPRGVAVNSKTSRVYVTNYGSNTVSVIDGSTNVVIGTVSVGSSPYGVGTDATTDKVYVANFHSNNVSVIDGSTTAIVATVPVGANPSAIGVNNSTNKIFVSNLNDNTVSVIDGSTNTVVNAIPVGFFPYGVDVNPATGMVYVANYGSNTVSVIDSSMNRVVTTVSVGLGPTGVGVNGGTNRIYVTNNGANSLDIIDGVTSSVVSVISVGTSPTGIGVNAFRNMVYVANLGSNSLSVITGHSSFTKATCSPYFATVSTGTSCSAIVEDTSTFGPTSPTGSVTFSIDSSLTPFASCSSTVVNATASSCSVTFIPAPGTQGTHTITALYPGDITHPQSSGTTTVSVFDFSISNSGSIVGGQGGNSSNTVTVSLVSGISQLVTLSCTSGLPPGATCTFSRASAPPPFSSILTILTSSFTPTGSYTINVAGVGEGQSHTTQFTLIVQPFDFSILNISNTAGCQGCSVSSTVTLGLVSGSPQSTTLSCTNDLPAGALCSFSPPSGFPGFSSILTITSPPSTPTGSYTITITGSGGGQTHSTGFVFRICLPLKGDVNSNCKVDIADLSIVAAAFGSTPSSSNWNPKADLNGDNLVDIIDLAAVATLFGKSS